MADHNASRPPALPAVCFVLLAAGIFLGILAAMAPDGFGFWSVLGSVEALLVIAAGVGMLQRFDWARKLALVMLYVGVASTLVTVASVPLDVLTSSLKIVGVGLLRLVLAVTLSGYLTTEPVSRWFTDARGQFLAYVANKVATPTALVLAILIVAGRLTEDYVLRLDLTKDQRFSISAASHRLAGAVEDPLTIRAYFSNNIPERIQPLQRQVFDILDEYEAHGGGKVKVERYDPQESRAAASEAETYGIQPVNLQVYEATQASAIQVYGGIVLLYRDKSSEVINIAQRYSQGYEGLSVLEYEISSKIWQLTNDKPKIGLCGHLSSAPERSPFPGAPPQPPKPHFSGMRRLLGEAFTIEQIDLDQEAPDPKKLALLLVARPKEFSDVALFRLDQYLMKGGRVLMFLTQGEIGLRGGLSYTPFKTGLDEWLAHHGVRVPNEFVCHLSDAMPIPVQVDLGGGLRGIQYMPNWFAPRFSGEDMIDQDNPAVQTLNTVALWWPHPIDVLDHKLGGRTATVLVRSSARQSWRWKDLARVDMTRLRPEIDAPSLAERRSSPVAVALEGTFESFYASKPVPPSLLSAAEKDGESEDEEKEPEPPEVVKQNAEPTQLVIIGNATFFSDLILAQDLPDDQKRMAGLLAFNLVDWLARSKDLIPLRAKRYTNRALVDKDYEADIDTLEKRVDDGEIGAGEVKQELDKVRERQKDRWKKWRWINIFVPALLILVAGAVVWIVRAANRARETRIPEPVPPASVSSGE